MILRIGTDKKDSNPLFWNSEDVINGHWMVVGSSGTGKTHTLKKLLLQFAQNPALKIHVFDSQGDLNVPSSKQTAAKFSETSPFGINPFEVDADPDCGGVRRSVSRFLSMMNRYAANKLGERQQAVLRNILYDIYAEHGYLYSKPESWRTTEGKKPPTLFFVKKYLEEKHISLTLGCGNGAFKALEAVQDKFYSLCRETGKQPDEKDDEIVEKLIETCVEKYRHAVECFATGRELKEFRRYENTEVLQSVLLRIENLFHTGIFKDRRPEFVTSKPVWLYDIKNLNELESGFLVEVYLHKIYARARQNGLSPSSELRVVVVIDEAQRYIDASPDHIVNVLVREGRKYGIGLVFASQNVDLFSKDVITNCASKLLLGIDETEQACLSRKFGIKISHLKGIQPQQTALVQIKTKRDYLSNDFKEVMLQ